MAQVTVELGHLLERTDFELFDFDYVFNDETFKKEIEQHVIDHYRFSEIGQETPERFKHVFKTRYLSLIGYYNELHNTSLLKYNPLINYSITDLMEQLTNTVTEEDTLQNMEGTSNSGVEGVNISDSTTNTTGTRTDDLKSTASTDSNSKRTDDLKSNVSAESTSKRTDDLEQLTTAEETTSDYPQQSISGSDSDYADTAGVRESKNLNTGTVESEDNSSSETSNTGTVESEDNTYSDTTNTGTVDDVSETKVEGTDTHETTTTGSTVNDVVGSSQGSGKTDMNYEKTVEGLTGRTYQELIQLERDNLLRIKAMIAEELKPCFIMVY